MTLAYFTNQVEQTFFKEINWCRDNGMVEYQTAVAKMERLVKAIRQGDALETVWLLEHPPIYTAGTSADNSDLLKPDRFPVFRTGRGGEFAYHGPGQRIAYVFLDLKRRHLNVRAYVHALEEWLIQALQHFGVQGERREGRVGIWVRRIDLGDPIREDKLAAIGVRVQRWVTLHGVALNVNPDLSHFDGIVPCGISNHGITSLIDLGVSAKMSEVDEALADAFNKVFSSYGKKVFR
ncbi:lipoyltransferase [Candidatus Endolissoclinum faulkneri L5]|uniref:Octanoyltransferase n=1 Tax=Candidatus Endolissoclinum faulkneri L5 TaxID=1401328 RepID=V9TW13_9PROT|nr:lipoyl(octanoyl) transferase LipB [Candidatus Endolissoclinum faulkneri]AHC73893.1 lipoyltransferase [Candidatus Endolissoclinum faulkneri L5]